MADLVFFPGVCRPCQLPDDNAEPDDRDHPARLFQSLAVIASSSVVNREKDKRSVTLVLFLGDTTCGAERDLGARALLLPLAVSQPPISQTGNLPLLFPAFGDDHERGGASGRSAKHTWQPCAGLWQWVKPQPPAVDA
jgi:hypothetical protein